MTADEFAKMHDVMDVYYGVNRSQRLDDDEKLNVALGRTTDWIDMLIGNGMQTSHNLTVSGGNKKETHFLNIGYTKEEGNMKPEGFDRLSASMKLNMNITNTIKYLRDSGFSIVAATEKGDYDYTKGDYTKPTCIIMGAEDTGVPYEHLALCDEWIKIPLFGTIESLNVSVAAGILIYEAIKQRGFSTEE